jgi:hypothetical protein
MSVEILISVMKKIKKWLLPGRHNNHHPYILRPLGLGLVLLLITLTNLSYNYSSARQIQVLGYATNISASEVIGLTNQQRANNGLGALSYDAQLTQAAQAKADDMFAQNYWSHYNPQGQGPAYFIANAGYSYSTAGENLAKDFNSSSGVVNAWMNSAGHRANIVNGSYVHTGVAVVNGILQGAETTLVVAMYGAPTAAPAPAAGPAQPAATSAPTPAATTTQVAADTPAPTEPTPSPAEQPQTEQQKPLNAPATTTQEPPPAESSGEVQAASAQAIRMREELNWAQGASLVLLSTLLLINIMKHTVVWRTSHRGWRHIWFRAHPAAQYALLAVAIISTLTSSAGVIR